MARRSGLSAAAGAHVTERCLDGAYPEIGWLQGYAMAWVVPGVGALPLDGNCLSIDSIMFAPLPVSPDSDTGSILGV